MKLNRTNRKPWGPLTPQGTACFNTWSNRSLPLCRHVTVKTTPNHKFVFTVKTHHTVAAGSIAFSLPQVQKLAQDLVPTASLY